MVFVTYAYIYWVKEAKGKETRTRMWSLVPVLAILAHQAPMVLPAAAESAGSLQDVGRISTVNLPNNNAHAS